MSVQRESNRVAENRKRKEHHLAAVGGIILVIGGMTGIVLGSGRGESEESAARSVVRRPVPSATRVESSERRTLGEVASELGKECDRLDASSRHIAEQAAELLGSAEPGKTREFRLPSSQPELVPYLKRCLALIDEINREFDELVAGDSQVDTRERIVDARKNVSRLEKAGAVGVLARRQVRAWIEKDLMAVDALNAEWPAIRESISDLVNAARDFESGTGSHATVVEQHQRVVKSASNRTLFHESELGQLCRDVHAAAEQLHQQRQNSTELVRR